MSTGYMAAFARDNQTGYCSVWACTKHRHGTGKYCAMHKKRVQRYGHVSGKQIRASRYTREREDVLSLLTANPEHEGIKVGLAFLRDYLTRASRFERVPGVVKLQRSVAACMESGRTLEDLARDVLVTSSALWLYSTRWPSDLPDDVRLTVALARGVLVQGHGYAGVSDQHVDGPDLKDIGLHLRRHIGLLLLNIAHVIEDAKQAAERNRRALSRPLMPTCAYTQEAPE
jgi:hypothetical protein